MQGRRTLAPCSPPTPHSSTPTVFTSASNYENLEASSRLVATRRGIVDAADGPLGSGLKVSSASEVALTKAIQVGGVRARRAPLSRV